MQYDAHVTYFRNHLAGWKSHIVNGRRIGRYSFEWYIGLTPRN